MCINMTTGWVAPKSDIESESNRNPNHQGLAKILSFLSHLGLGSATLCETKDAWTKPLFPFFRSFHFMPTVANTISVDGFLSPTCTHTTTLFRSRASPTRERAWHLPIVMLRVDFFPHQRLARCVLSVCKIMIRSVDGLTASPTTEAPGLKKENVGIQRAAVLVAHEKP